MANWRDRNSATYPQILAKGVGTSHTGTTGEVTLATVTLDPNDLSVGDNLRIDGIFEIDNGAGGAPAGTVTTRVKVNGTSAVSIGTVASSLPFSKQLVVKNATTLMTSGNTYYRDEKATASLNLTVDITGQIVITFTGTLTNAADTFYLRSYVIQVIK